MFGSKRRRATSNPPLNGSTANSNATTAAAQAFLKNRSSNASLASAAAGAALRSRPTTPTNVADVQTKRTIKRTGSTSSMGSSVAGSSSRGPSQLERRGSQGSMTERTFRDPSPARTPAQSQPVPSAPDAPPVPAIPKNMQQGQPPIPTKSHRRAASMEAPGLRVASPPPNKANGRGSSLGPTGSTQPPRKAGQRTSVSGLPSMQELTGVERPASRGSVHSVNFSMPTGSRQTSPLGHRRLTSCPPSRQNLPKIVSPTNQNLIYDPNTRSFLPEAQILANEQRYNDAANKPVKKKKKVVPGAGTHLASGGMGAKPRGTAIDAMEAAASNPVPAQQPFAAPVPVTQTSSPAVKAILPPARTLPPPGAEPAKATTQPRRRKKKVSMSDSESDIASYNAGSSDTDSDVPQTFNTRAGALLAKKPSIVREDREREEQEDDTPGRMKAGDGLARLDTGSAATRQISPSPLPRSAAGRGHGRGQARASAAFARQNGTGRSASQPPSSPSDSPIEGAGIVSRDSVRGGRVQSVSPARQAHFATTPDSLMVKHQPPARSISPRKSAMKRSNSPMGPSEDLSEVDGSEASGSVIGSNDLAVPKKKANRVSFDETNVAVGQAATPVTTDSPVVQSPQARRSWFSMNRGKKKEPVMADEDDEVMKPRPALPSFGSVRERKTSREVEERPLVKPAEIAEEKVAPASPPLFTSPTGETFEYPMGQSNDHVVGSILSQDATTKNAANISKSREPLPPEVTSVEGTGYHSDTNSSIHSIVNQKSEIGVLGADSVARGPTNEHVDHSRALISHEEALPAEHTNGKSVVNDEHEEEEEDKAPTPKANDIVPEIAILQATPTLEEHKGWPDMPGAWGYSTSDSSSNNHDEADVVQPRAIEPTPAIVGVAEPSPITHAPIPPQQPEVVEAAHQNPSTIMEETEESDADASIYSDAAEELTDTEGDGFMSLNAVVESPAPKNGIPGLALSTPPDSPTTKVFKEKAYKKSQLSRNDSAPDPDAGWDRVQAYWSTLSADKKKQLEMEAREEAEDSESTIEAKPAPKPRKKKVAVQSEPTVVQIPRQDSVQHDRNYMIQPGAKAGPNGHGPMRTSMRADPPSTIEEPHIRKSMRGPGAMRGSLRGSSETAEPKGSLQKKYRPMSQPPPAEVKTPPVNRHVRALSAASAAAAPAAAQRDMAPKPKPALRRRGSGDSDSSFKRAKPSNNNEIPKFRGSMRRSVEQESVARPLSPTQSSRFSLRSLSPTGSAFRRSFNGSAQPVNSTPTHMRNSLRSNTRETPTLRNSTSKTGGFGRGSSAKPSKQKSRPNKSRFADSSDEDEDRPAFRSRFDSSDEDEPTALPTPRTMQSNRTSKLQDVDSEDLSDSDVEKPSIGTRLGKGRAKNTNGTTTTALASGSLRRSGSGRETLGNITTATATTPIRPDHKRRGSFMSILRRKKPDPASKVRKPDLLESPARRDTPLERSKSDLLQLREGASSPKPQSPRLQKRQTISRGNSNQWPLPAPPVIGGDDGRPFSADAGQGVSRSGVGDKAEEGGEGSARPDLGTRRFTATGVASVDLSAVTGDVPGKKKKKFGAWRRLFKLDE